MREVRSGPHVTAARPRVGPDARSRSYWKHLMLSSFLQRRSAPALSLFTVLALGCGSTVNLTPADASPPVDGGVPTEARTLELLGPSSLELVYDDAAELSVQLTGLDGAPVEGADVSFTLDGNANDSTLGTLSDTTDMAGLAQGRVLAGRTATTFRVRVAATGAASVFVQVSVSGNGFGAVDARLIYRSARTLDHLEARLFAGSSCAAAVAGDLIPDRSLSLLPDASQALFSGLPARVRYALVVDGVGAEDVTLGRGCLEDVLVTEAETSLVDVRIEDLPLDPVGEYDTTISLSAGSLSATLADALRLEADTQVADAGGDVSVLLDALNSYFLDAGDLPSAALLAAERAGTSLEVDLDARLIVDAAGPSVAMAELADSVDSELARVEINGVLTLGPDGVLSFRARQVSAGQAGTPLALLDLASLGVHLRTEFVANLLPGEDAARIESLDIQLPGGVLSRARISATALAAGLDSAAPWLAARAGCDSFAAFLSEDPALASSCDAGCAAVVCEDAMASLWVSMRPAFDRLDIERAGVNLSGRVEFLEETGDLRVDRLSATGLVARTTGESASSDRLEASVEGNRAAFLP